MSQTCQETSDCTGHGWVGGGDPLVYQYGTTFTTGNPIIGETISQITYNIKKDSGTTSTDKIYMMYKNAAGTVTTVSTTTYVINDLPTSFGGAGALKSFTFNNITVGSGDRFIVYQDGVTSASQKWGICESATIEFTGNTTGRLQDGSWSATNGSTDYCFTTGTVPPTDDTILLPPPVAWI